MSETSEWWLIGITALAATVSGVGTAVAVVRRRDLPQWPGIALAILGTLPLLRPPSREYGYAIVVEAQAAPWVLALLLGLWVPALALPAALHPGPDARPTGGRAAAALAVAALILVASTVRLPSPLPIVAVPLIVVLVVAALRTSERLSQRRRIAAETAAVAAAVVLGASAVWDWLTDASLAWSAVAVLSAAAIVTDRPQRLALMAVAGFVPSAASQMFVTKGGVEAWIFEQGGGVLLPATEGDLRWGAYDPVPDPIGVGEPVDDYSVLLVDVGTPWSALELPKRDLQLWFVLTGPDGYAFRHLLLVEDAYAIELRKQDDGRVSVAGAPPIPMGELLQAIETARAGCPSYPLVMLVGPWTVGEVLAADSAIAERTSYGTCQWQDGDWVDVPEQR